MNPLLLLGALGVGGYLLLSSSTASAAARPPAPPGMTPRATPLPTTPQEILYNYIPDYSQPGGYDPSSDPGPTTPSGGVVLDPNLGGVPDMSSQLPVQPWQSVVAGPTEVGTVGWNPFTRRWY